MAIRQRSKRLALESRFLDAQFVFRTVEILGPEYASVSKPPYEGQILRVVGFRPRLKNNVVVHHAAGDYSLMPLYMVEKALSLKSLQGAAGETHSQGTEGA